ncbi:MAG: hypothetical protein DWH99_08755 [Planctomycetota bacterium]|nr:MAG: hypothetical protein DWH99_08755 [Planctomycetota bacterium]
MRNENDACGPRDLVTSKKRPRTSVQRLVLDFFRARARARSIMRLYHSIPVNALLGQEFGNG